MSKNEGEKSTLVEESKIEDQEPGASLINPQSTPKVHPATILLFVLIHQSSPVKVYLIFFYVEI